MAEEKGLKFPKDMSYEPGSKGHKLDFGGVGNRYVFDLDEDGGVTNLRPDGEPAPAEADDESE